MSLTLKDAVLIVNKGIGDEQDAADAIVCGLDPLERAACEHVARNEEDVAALLEAWCQLSLNGRAPALDEALGDSLERLLSQALWRLQHEKDEQEGLGGDQDEHEALGFGA